jgi:phospholipid transport system substrate-binding protein
MFRTLAIALTLGTSLSLAQAETAPDAFVMKLSTEVIDAVKADKAIQAGDVGKIRTLVDTKVLPNVNLQRMVIKSVGQPWRSATPEQQKRLTEEFKSYLINTYSGALTQVRDQTVKLRPVRAGSNANEALIGTDVVNKGEPIQLDYRLEKAGDTWKIYDFNVLGLWATDSFRSQFAADLRGGGVDALIARLSEKNKQISGGSGSKN